MKNKKSFLILLSLLITIFFYQVNGSDFFSVSAKSSSMRVKKSFDGDKIESIYTNLNDKNCKTIELSVEGTGYYRGQCKGIGGYKLEITEGDIRQSINVINTKSGKKWELDFMRNVSYAFSYVGVKAEWRVKKVNGKIQPIALIIRFYANEDPEDYRKNNEYLVVTKFDNESVCITDVVKPMRKQNEKARELADASAAKPCLKKE